MGPAFGANLGSRRRRARAGRGRRVARGADPRDAQGAGRGARAQAGRRVQPVRVALTGSTVSEPVNELLAVVGRDAALWPPPRGRRQSDQGGDARAPGVIRRAGLALALGGARGLRRQAVPRRADTRSRYRSARAAHRRRAPPPPLPPRRPRVRCPSAWPSSATSTWARRRCPAACRPTAGAACSTRRGPLLPATWSSATSRACWPTRERPRSASAMRAAGRAPALRARASGAGPSQDTASTVPSEAATPSAPRRRWPRACVDAGFTHLNLANNHANDFGPAGRASTEPMLDSLGLRRYGPLGRIAIDTVRRGDSLTTVGLIGFTTYPFAYDLLDIARSAAVVDSLRPLVDLLVVTFHGGRRRHPRAARAGGRRVARARAAGRPAALGPRGDRRGSRRGRRATARTCSAGSSSTAGGRSPTRWEIS